MTSQSFRYKYVVSASRHHLTGEQEVSEEIPGGNRSLTCSMCCRFYVGKNYLTLQEV